MGISEKTFLITEFYFGLEKYLWKFHNKSYFGRRIKNDRRTGKKYLLGWFC
jgi:hypothetical protein